MITQNSNRNISFSHTFLEKVWQKAFDGSRPKFVFGFVGGKPPPWNNSSVPLTKTSPNFIRALFQVKENKKDDKCPLETKSVKRVRSFYQGEVRTLSEGENFPPMEKTETSSSTFCGQSFPALLRSKARKKI